MNVELNPDQIRRARKAMARLDGIKPVLDKCARCGIPIEEASQIRDEHEQRLHALITEFAPQSSLQAYIQQREQQKHNHS